MFNQYNEDHTFSLRRLCRAAHVPYRSFLRWRRRRGEGRPAVLEPGPQPAGPLDMAAVERQVGSLHHGNHRTQGTGRLYGQLRGVISRRKLQALVERTRAEAKAARRASQWRLEWSATPGRAWAMDTKQINLAGGRKVWFQTLRDLGARYTLAPCALHCPDGGDIAAWLEDAFAKHGAPQFLRMDNAANENCPEVLAVLARHWVVPFNSPPHYPRYNGGVECAQREIEEGFEDWTAGLDAIPPEHIPAYANATLNDLNHRRRPVLGGRHACQVFARKPRHAMLTPGKRKEVVNALTAVAAALIDGGVAANRHHIRKAWRRAVEWWLETNGIIRVVKTPECQPISA
jgi:hypothetical protein